MPHDDGGTTRNIQRVLGAMLRNFDTHVTGIDHLLAHALDLVAHHHSDLFPFFDNKLFEAHTVMYLLDRTNQVAVTFQILDCSNGSGIVLPVDRFLGSQGSLVNFGFGRLRRDAAWAVAA